MLTHDESTMETLDRVNCGELLNATWRVSKKGKKSLSTAILHTLRGDPSALIYFTTLFIIGLARRSTIAPKQRGQHIKMEGMLQRVLRARV